MKRVCCCFVTLFAIPSPSIAEAAGTLTWKNREIEVRPAKMVTVTGEKHKLSAEPFRSYRSVNLLKHPRCYGPGRGMPVLGALDPASLVVRHGDEVLKLGKDYLCDNAWAALRLGPESAITPADEVRVDYRYSLRRADSLVRTADGKEIIVEGQDARVLAKPPELTADEAPGPMWDRLEAADAAGNGAVSAAEIVKAALSAPRRGGPPNAPGAGGPISRRGAPPSAAARPAPECCGRSRHRVPVR